jgi:hypothetical protein
MRKFKRLGKIIGIVLISIIALYGMMFVVDRILYGESYYSHNSYPTYSAAAAANAIGGDSVIPPFLPHSATGIRYITYHDLDISRLWVSFIFDPKDTSEIHKYCKRVTEGKVRYWGGRPKGDFIRWPEEITGTVRIEDLPDYELYWCELGTREQSLLGIKTGVLSVNINSGKAYYSKDADFLED